MDTNKNCYYFLPLPGPIEIRRTAGLWLQRLFQHLTFWIDRAAQRRNLAALDDRMLKDVGLNRVDAVRESGKWFWQA
jgi:uncharacterized protein YjiS (DUF1127 family)